LQFDVVAATLRRTAGRKNKMNTVTETVLRCVTATVTVRIDVREALAFREDAA
jgi:hypothetical protein